MQCRDWSCGIFDRYWQSKVLFDDLHFCRLWRWGNPIYNLASLYPCLFFRYILSSRTSADSAWWIPKFSHRTYIRTLYRCLETIPVWPWVVHEERTWNESVRKRELSILPLSPVGRRSLFLSLSLSCSRWLYHTNNIMLSRRYEVLILQFNRIFTLK